MHTIKKSQWCKRAAMLDAKVSQKSNKEINQLNKYNSQSSTVSINIKQAMSLVSP